MTRARNFLLRLKLEDAQQFLVYVTPHAASCTLFTIDGDIAWLVARNMRLKAYCLNLTKQDPLRTFGQLFLKEVLNLVELLLPYQVDFDKTAISM